MKTHDLKLVDKYFEPVLYGIKNFEVRLNDRDYRIGDILVLRETNSKTGKYTGNVTKRVITYITDFNQQEGYVILGISEVTCNHRIQGIISEMLALIDESEWLLKEYTEQESKLDKECSDFLHLLEFTDFTDQEGVNISRELQSIRQNRRLVNNTNRILRSTVNALDLPSLRDKLHSVYTSNDQKIKMNDNRQYTPKVRVDLCDKFK